MKTAVDSYKREKLNVYKNPNKKKPTILNMIGFRFIFEARLLITSNN